MGGRRFLSSRLGVTTAVVVSEGRAGAGGVELEAASADAASVANASALWKENGGKASVKSWGGECASEMIPKLGSVESEV